MKRTIKLMNIGSTGSGKTHLAATFPKSYFLITEPNGEDTFLNNPILAKNVVKYEHFMPTSPADTKAVFERLNKACNDAREMAKKGEIETLVLDNMTYLAENRWAYINAYEKLYTVKGEVDTRGMYGMLGRWLYQFTLMNLLTFPGNVVMSVHEKLESDEALAKKPDKNHPVVPSILGGFRDDAGGMFSAVFYLQCLRDSSGYHYFARTRKGSGRNAKNRYNLPEVIENVSYDTIMEAMKIEEIKK